MTYDKEKTNTRSHLKLRTLLLTGQLDIINTKISNSVNSATEAAAEGTDSNAGVSSSSSTTTTSANDAVAKIEDTLTQLRKTKSILENKLDDLAKSDPDNERSKVEKHVFYCNLCLKEISPLEGFVLVSL